MTMTIKPNTSQGPTTEAMNCFKCSSDLDISLLAVREGVPVDKALLSALCMISSALEIIYADTDDHSEPVHGATYLLEIAKGIVASCQGAAEIMRIASERNNKLEIVN